MNDNDLIIKTTLKNENAQNLAKLGKGTKRVLSEAEKQKRRERLAVARSKRWQIKPKPDLQIPTEIVKGAVQSMGLMPVMPVKQPTMPVESSFKHVLGDCPRCKRETVIRVEGGLHCTWCGHDWRVE